MGKKEAPLTEKERFFKRLSHQTEELFNIEQKYITTHQDRLRFSSLLGNRSYPWGLGAIVEKQEGALFKLLAREGPIVLSHPDIQDKIKKWLGSPYEASAKLNNMKDALLIYAMRLKKEGAGKHIRGARKAEITRVVGAEKVLDVYEQFLSKLKELRTFIRTRGNPAGALLEWGNKLINNKN